MKQKKFTIYDLVLIGLMAALCYVGTLFRIEIPTPIGKTMIHLGNIFCLLSGLLLGKIRGGLASGIGSAVFDLLTGWATSAPSTFINKFVMGFLAGAIPRLKNNNGKNLVLNIIGAACGIYSYIVLYLTYSFFKNIILGSAIETAFTDVIFKAPISFINGTLALVISVILYQIIRPILEKTSIYKKTN